MPTQKHLRSHMEMGTVQGLSEASLEAVGCRESPSGLRGSRRGADRCFSYLSRELGL